MQTKSPDAVEEEEVICSHCGSLSEDKYLYIMADQGGLCETLARVVVIVAAQVIYAEIERLYACTAAEWRWRGVLRNASCRANFSIMRLKECVFLINGSSLKRECR